MAKKAVLIFDVPTNCFGCPCHDNDYICCNAYGRRSLIGKEQDKPNWCPLVETTQADITRARMFLNRIECERENRL